MYVLLNYWRIWYDICTCSTRTAVLLCASGSYLRVKNDSSRLCVWYIRVHVIWYICIEKRFPGIFFLTRGIGECSLRPSLHSNLVRRQKGTCTRRRHMRAYVGDYVACAMPTWCHINTDKSHAFTSLASCLGQVDRTYFSGPFCQPPIFHIEQV